MANGADFNFDISGFDEDLQNTLQQSREAFKGKYKEELNALSGLSHAEINTITPDTTDLEKYDQLIAVVKEASRKNLSQIELRRHIESLGEVAVAIAKRVPALASVFV